MASKEKREKKASIIDQVQASLSKSSICILTDYRGLTANDVTNLRRKLREAGVEYRVVKNTLARFAAERAGKAELASLLEGPVALSFGYGDVAQPAKVLTDYIRAQKTSLEIKGGILGDRMLTSKDIATLITLPSREQLLAKVLGGMQSPIVKLLNCLNSPMQGLLGVLQARIKQMEEQNVSR
jgi:large subunit ribosomal protein L10